MEIKYISTFLLLLCLFQLGLGDIVEVEKIHFLKRLDYDSNEGWLTAIVPDAYKFQKYHLAFPGGSYPNYIKIEATSKKGIYSPILTFSIKDENAKESRLQLSKSLFINNTMWIKKEQFQNGNLYVAVECLNETECGYNLTFSGHDSITFEKMTSYKYYVSQDNTQMVFRFKNENEGQENLVTLYATGGRNVSLSLANCNEESCKQFNFTEGAAITIKNKNINYYDLTVNAKVGDYITVGGKIIDKNGKSLQNILEPEYGQLSGFLRKGQLEKECYMLPKEENDIYYITGTLFNSMAEIKFLDENSQLLQESIQVTDQGFFSSIYNSTNSKRRYICISFLEIESFPKESISYSIQIQSKKNFGFNAYNQQYTGFIYPRISPTGTLTYFNNLHSKEGLNYTVYNMLTIRGYPKMYIYSCENYPNCDLDYETIDKNEKVERITEINRMSSYDYLINKTGSSPIDAKQSILVVKCNKTLLTMIIANSLLQFLVIKKKYCLLIVNLLVDI